MDRKLKLILSKEINRVIYVSSVSLFCLHSSDVTESVHIESAATPEEHFSKRLKSVVGTDDTYASRNAADQLHTKPFADNLQTVFRCPRPLRVVLAFFYAPT